MDHTVGGPTVGVEEEFHLVDAATMALRPRADRVLPEARRRLGERVTAEITLSQVEVSTPVCGTLDDARGNLAGLRRTVAEVAAAHESAILASGTHPFTDWLGQAITPGRRYERLEEDFQQLAREQLVCGCHVHVAVPDLPAAVAVMDRVRPWLAVLLALSANSPFWQGIDTGYASYRWTVFRRWPTTGTPPHFGSVEAYEELVDSLVRARVVPDASFLYWDVRPSTRFSTVEFRVADVCTDIDDAVAVAGLCRSLVRTALADPRPVDPAPAELLQAASWQAARYGLEARLIDVPDRSSRSAPEVVRGLLARLRDDLDGHGEWDAVAGAVERILADGNGAVRQRRAFAATGSLADVARAVLAA